MIPVNPTRPTASCGHRSEEGPIHPVSHALTAGGGRVLSRLDDVVRGASVRLRGIGRPVLARSPRPTCAVSRGRPIQHPRRWLASALIVGIALVEATFLATHRGENGPEGGNA